VTIVTTCNTFKDQNDYHPNYIYVMVNEVLMINKFRYMIYP